MKLENLETPALIVDLDVMESNMAAMSRLLEGTGMGLRPHYKSHRCTAIAHRQIAAGAKGMTCAKLSEAGSGLVGDRGYPHCQPDKGSGQGGPAGKPCQMLPSVGVCG